MASSQAHRSARHRKRISTSRLSSDTVLTLPVYSSPTSAYHRHNRSIEETLSDRPPDYPDSAEEADADSESDGAPQQSLYVPQQPTPLTTSPRRAKRFHPPPRPQHKRQSASASQIDSYLDSLLERSVHALEMSNALLHSTQTSPQASTFTPQAAERDARRDSFLDSHPSSSTARSRDDGDRVHTSWQDDLEEIARGVDGLLGESSGSRPAEGSVSQSLPQTSSMPSHLRRPRRRPSLDTRSGGESSDMPHLQLSSPDRNHLISPPPRALTQYIESSADPDAIVLPSTIGLRAASSSYSSHSQSHSGCSLHSAHSDALSSPESSTALNRRIGFHASVSSPALNDRPLEPTTPAYNLLSSFVRPSAQAAASSSAGSTPSSSFTTKASFGRNRRGSSSTERGSTASGGILSPSPERSILGRRGSLSRSRSVTPKRTATPPPLPRPMTPPIEELSSSSSSSDAPPNTQRTQEALQKILEKHPVEEKPRKVPAFMPRSPAPAPLAGTSTSTVSVSRLYTNPKHSSSTRPSSPPRHSSLKRSSVPPTPTHSPSASQSMMSIPDVLGFGSRSSSGRSTPKRISFAELPESYMHSKPGGPSLRFKAKKRNQDARRGSRAGKGDGKGKEAEPVGWWAGWLLGTGPAGYPTKHEERVEERASRGWGGRPGMGSGLDDWTL